MLYILFYYVWKPRFRSEVENRNQPVEKKWCATLRLEYEGPKATSSCQNYVGNVY